MAAVNGSELEMGWGPPIDLEEKIVDFEHYANAESSNPLFAFALGIARFALGVIQVLAGAVVALVALFPAPFDEQARVTCQRGWSHLINGMANIVVAFVQATWIGALAITAARDAFILGKKLQADGCALRNKQELFFVGYKKYDAYFMRCEHRSEECSHKKNGMVEDCGFGKKTHESGVYHVNDWFRL